MRYTPYREGCLKTHHSWKTAFRETGAFIAVIYAFALAGSLTLSYLAATLVGESEALAVMRPADFTPDATSRILDAPGREHISYTCRFPDAGLRNSFDEYGILLPRLESNGYKVFINNILIGQVGSLKTGNSNIWNSSFFFIFDPSILKSENVLRIDSLALYKTGLSSHPVYLMEESKAHAFQTAFALFNNGLVFACIGVFGISALFLLMFSFLSDTVHAAYASFALGMIAIATYSLDFTTILSLPVSYLTYKKITIVSFWATGMFFGIGIHRILGFRPVLICGIAGFAGILVLAAVSTNPVDFKIAYGYWYFMQLLNAVLWLVASIRAYKTRIEGKILFWGFSILFVCSGISLAFDASGIFLSLNTPITYMATFGIIPLMLVYFDVVAHRNKFISERERRKIADRWATLDALTGVYNKHYYDGAIRKAEIPSVLILFDFDDFKAINDTYGHQGGDEVLRHVATEFNRLLRKEDLFCRIGGDEFVAVFPASLETSKKRIEAFRLHLSRSPAQYKGIDIPVTLSWGLAVLDGRCDAEECFRKADNALYASKRGGKDLVTVAEN